MIIVNARFLTQNVTGVQRFAIEMSKQLKMLLGNQVHFVSPKNVQHECLAQELGAEVIGVNVALFLLAALGWRVVRLSLAPNAAAWRLPVVLALVAYGVVVNEIEAGLLAFFWGMALSMPNQAGSGSDARVRQ